ncbi:MAG: transporter substrate-binding domain-containing protein [Acidimicrobiales bacterium]
MSKRLLALLALLLTFGLLAAACGDDDDTAAGDDSDDSDDSDDLADGELPDLEGRTVTVAIENAYLPFNYIDAETGEPGGWDYDAIDAMCALINCTPEYVAAAWDGMIVAVADGQYDMAADGITITDERAEVVDFSDGYINLDQRILVRVGEDRFTDSASLAADDSLRIGSQVGTTNYDTAVELAGEDRVDAFEQFGFAVQALIAGDVDAVIMDETAGQGYVGENADDVELIGESLSSDQLGFIFPKGSDLVEPFNAAIAAMKADGSLESISTEYFGDSFTITSDDIAEVEYDG